MLIRLFACKPPVHGELQGKKKYFHSTVVQPLSILLETLIRSFKSRKEDNQTGISDIQTNICINTKTTRVAVRLEHGARAVRKESNESCKLSYPREILVSSLWLWGIFEYVKDVH